MLFLEGESNHPSVLLHLQHEGGEKKKQLSRILVRQIPQGRNILELLPRKREGEKERDKARQQKSVLQLGFEVTQDLSAVLVGVSGEQLLKRLPFASQTACTPFTEKDRF